jgi:hypothetical protein
LYVDDILKDTATGISKGDALNFNYSVSSGAHSWFISCSDENTNAGQSAKRILTIVPATQFGGKTTDLSSVNIENISHLVIEDSATGMINFTDNVNLSGGANLNDYVIIGKNLINIDTRNLPQLNKSAVITLYNLSFVHPVIMKNNASCNECNILSYNSNLTFSVQHFTSYSASENSRLEIWDDTDNERKTQMHKRRANYRIKLQYHVPRYRNFHNVL